MLFTSVSFVLFAALTVLLYYAVPKRAQWCVLLAASWLFYLFSGAEYFVFILYTTVVTYLTAILMQRNADREDAFVEANREGMEKAERKAYRAAEKKKRFRVLLAGLLLGFGMLAVLKYTAFVMSGVSAVASLFGGDVPIPSLLLPLGISFYTFQSMGYLIDVYRKKARAERNFFRTALFVSYFPQLVQGPISRFSDLSAELFTPHAFEGSCFRRGLLRTTWGYFKKTVVADTALIAVRELVLRSDELNGVYVFLLILLYSAEIYGDFTGGIDITIGLSEMMGIRLAENFDRPFSSATVKEYWRRWHVTMGTWFSDYVFYPLSVSERMQKLSKWSRAKLGNALGKRIPVYLATVVTWFLTGLWHGAGWNFIVWGLLNCFAILISQELQPLWNRFAKRFPRLVASRGWGIFRCVRTFLLMGLFRSLDCYRDVPKTFRLWWSMLSVPNAGEVFRGGLLSFGLGVSDWIVLLCGIAVIFAVSQLGKREPLRCRVAEKPVLTAVCASVLVVLVLVFGAYGIGYDASQFIYNQF